MADAFAAVNDFPNVYEHAICVTFRLWRRPGDFDA